MIYIRIMTTEQHSGPDDQIERIAQLHRLVPGREIIIHVRPASFGGSFRLQCKKNDSGSVAECFATDGQILSEPAGFVDEGESYQTVNVQNATYVMQGLSSIGNIDLHVTGDVDIGVLQQIAAELWPSENREEDNVVGGVSVEAYAGIENLAPNVL